MDTDYETPCFIHFKHFDNFVSLTFISLLFVDDDLFSNFVSASSAAESADHLSAPSCDSSNQTKPTATEDDFFNQVGFKIQSHKSFLLWVGVSIRFGAFFFPSNFFSQASPGNIAGTTIDPSKMSNSSIMALFSSGSSSSTSTVNSQGMLTLPFTYDTLITEILIPMYYPLFNHSYDRQAGSLLQRTAIMICKKIVITFFTI